MNGEKMPRQEVADLLRAAAKAVEERDSFQGSIMYSCMEDGLGPDEYEVEAFIRHGNSMGQGGAVVIRGGDDDAPLRLPHPDNEWPDAVLAVQNKAHDPEHRPCWCPVLWTRHPTHTPACERIRTLLTPED